MSTVTRMMSSDSCLMRREVMGVECSKVGEQFTSRSHTLKFVSMMKSYLHHKVAHFYLERAYARSTE